MRLTDILHPDCVQVPLNAGDKQTAIYTLVDLLAETQGIADAAALKEAVWRRETTRTTGIGHGIAIPHGKSAGVSELCMAIGRTAKPLDFNAIDGKPVDLVLLLVSPQDQTGPHIQALAKISRMLTDDTFRSALKASATSDEAYQLIVDHEANAPV